MKRRTFGLMSACSAVALAAGVGLPRAANAANAALLKGGLLTPTGAEIAGNADGSIPAWTGGLTTVPAGWVPGTPFPDPFEADEKLFTIDASNYTKYQDKLTDGVIALIQTYGFSLDVYKTERTHALPQWVYDNIAANAANVVPDAGGSRLGFTGGFGGYPFPILSSDPLEAGAQAVWNHQCKWNGEQVTLRNSNYSVINGAITNLSTAKNYYRFPYYKQGGNPATDGKYLFQLLFVGSSPANNEGAQELVWSSTFPQQQHSIAWEYLAGQGRVRKVPQVEYDIPEAQTNGLSNYDDNWLFGGAMDRYDWKLLGKKEIYIPYNNGKVVQLTTAGLLPHYIDPSQVRWELHRVWVIDATLHPGERHVVPHRRLFLQEDTWFAALTDEWDAQGNLWKTGTSFQMNRPDLPGTLYFAFALYNFQQHGYVVTFNTDLAQPAGTHAFDFVTVPGDDLYNPQTMAERAQF